MAKSDPNEEEAPIFGSWAGMYWLVVGNLVLMILMFYLLTLRYA